MLGTPGWVVLVMLLAVLVMVGLTARDERRIAEDWRQFYLEHPGVSCTRVAKRVVCVEKAP